MDSFLSICRIFCGLYVREGDEAIIEEMNRRDERERVDLVLVRFVINRYELIGVY